MGWDGIFALPFWGLSGRSTGVLSASIVAIPGVRSGGLEGAIASVTASESQLSIAPIAFLHCRFPFGYV